MNEQQLSFLARVLEYLKDEEKDFEGASEEARSNHIDLDLEVLNEYLVLKTKGESA